MADKPEEFALDTLDGLFATFRTRSSVSHLKSVFFGMVYCPRCGGPRRAQAEVVEEVPNPDLNGIWGTFPVVPLWSKGGGLSIPTTLVFGCLQCRLKLCALVYWFLGEPALAVFPEQFGGPSTPHCPAGVAFYLDQAARSHAAGANTAATAMLRTAAEWLLEDQGFSHGMLGTRVASLEKALANGSAPKWASELEKEALTVLKDLGNMPLHTKSGDLTKQAQFDERLYGNARAVFAYLLEIIYERPARVRSMLGELNKPLP
jgi:hypothetical protein